MKVKGESYSESGSESENFPTVKGKTERWKSGQNLGESTPVYFHISSLPWEQKAKVQALRPM